jgi:ABC-type phosphate/phosphonate transport system permease subunit
MPDISPHFRTKCKFPQALSLSRFLPIYGDLFLKYPTLLVYFTMNNYSRTTSSTVATIAIVSAILLLGAVVVIPLVEQAHAAQVARQGPIKQLIQRALSIARSVLGGSQREMAAR